MKITKLKIKNMFGIKEYSMESDNVLLKGAKGTGKTSVLDAIRYALKNKSSRDIVLRQGENEGEIILETDTGVSIRRKSVAGKADVKTIKQDNVPVQRPEEFLRELFTEMQLNPVEFIRMTSNEQNRIILDLIDYDWSLDTIKEWFGELVPNVDYQQNILNVLNDIQGDQGYYFMARQDKNREARNKKAFIKEIADTLPDNFDCEKWEKVNLGGLYAEIEKSNFRNNQIEKAQTFMSTIDNKKRGFEGEAEVKRATLDKEITFKRSTCNTEIARLKEQIISQEKELAGLEETKKDKLEVIQAEYDTAVANLEGSIKEHKMLAGETLLDVQEWRDKAGTVEHMKGYINEYKRMIGLQGEMQGLIEESEEYTAKIEKARELPGEILKTVKIPIPGLTIEDGKPLIHDLPINNLSDGEKLELCVIVAIEKKTGLNLLLIDGVEKLDDANREKLFKLCKDRGVQFIATVTSNDKDLTVIEL